jgi:hypothetical protein
MAINVTLPVVPLPAPAEDLLKEAWEAGELIKIATEQIAELQERRDRIIEMLRSHGVTRAGHYEVMEKQRVTRKVNPSRFRQLFPDAYNRICDEEQRRLIASVGKAIRIQDAERLVGSDLLSPACDLTTSITHSVVKVVLE